MAWPGRTIPPQTIGALAVNTARMWTFNFKTLGSASWVGATGTESLGGVDINCYAINAGDTVTLDSSGIRVSGGNAAAGIQIEYQHTDANLDMTRADGVWAALLEFDSDAGDLQMHCGTGSSNYAGVTRDQAGSTISCIVRTGTFEESTVAQAGSSVRAIAVMWVGASNAAQAFYDNSGGAGPGQVLPYTLTFGACHADEADTTNHINGGVEKERIRLIWNSTAAHGVNFTRLTIWDLSAQANSEQT